MATWDFRATREDELSLTRVSERTSRRGQMRGRDVYVCVYVRVRSHRGREGQWSGFILQRLRIDTRGYGLRYIYIVYMKFECHHHIELYVC